MHWSYFYRHAGAIFTPEAFARARELMDRAREAARGNDSVSLRRRAAPPCAAWDRQSQN